MPGDNINPQTVSWMTRNEADMAFRKRVQTIFDWIQPRDHALILDIPCGRGFYLKMLRYVSRCRLVGAELDWEVVLKAKRNLTDLPEIMLNHADIYALPYSENTFDAVILSEVLEHLDDDMAGLREALRVLKPGGVAAITVPHANYPFWWDPINKTLETLFQTHIKSGPLAGIWANHVRLYTREQLENRVREAGFDISETRSFTHYCFPFLHNIVYGLGKPLLESGWLPGRLAEAADRTAFARAKVDRWNPVKLGQRLFIFFDRKNSLNEPSGRSTVNLALKAVKPLRRR